MYQRPNKRLIGHSAIVTGASSGIGSAIATSLGLDGANVVINYSSNKEGAEEVANAYAKIKPVVRPLLFNVGGMTCYPGFTQNG